MDRVTRQWVLSPPPPPEVEAALGGYRPIERKVLFNRGLRSAREAEAFLSPQEALPHDPFVLLGMDAAVDRLRRACREQESVVVYGDYDADGLTAAALLAQVLEGLGAQVRAKIPNRFEEGYGLQSDALRQLHQAGARIVVTVDCGIRSIAEAEEARALGLDLIITDHHHPGASIPRACAVVNPKQPGDCYPYKELSGSGLTFRLAQALRRQARQPEPSEHLDLVAVGTVADLVPLDGENRQLASGGLRQLNLKADPPAVLRPGVQALLEVARFHPGRIGASAIAFGIGPRLNAVGRLRSADAAYRLLVSRDSQEAWELAQELESANRERQELTRVTVETAKELVLDRGPVSSLVFVAHGDFNPGIVGLAAARLVEEFYRPVIIAAQGDETTRGSGRSIPEFHITRALDACADLLVRHGGHSSAAGFTLRTRDLDTLVERLQSLASDQLAQVDLRPKLAIDADVEFAALDRELLEFLEAIEPCGYGNPQPLLAARDVVVRDARAVGRSGSHLKLNLVQGRRAMEAIAFRLGHLGGELPRRVDIAFHLERNTYLGVETLQLNVIDIRPADDTD